MKIIYFILTLFCWLVTAGGFLVFGGLSWILSIVNPSRKYFYFQMARVLWSRALLRTGFVSLEIKGKENISGLPDSGVIFVANHQSMADILVCSASIPRYFVFILKEEILKVPLFGRYLRLAENIPIKRGGIKKAYEPLMEAEQRLSKGVSILLYPEGTRSKDGTVGEFKRGALYLAFHSGVPIIPMAITNTRNILKKGSFLVWPGKVVVEFGKPVIFSEELKENKDSQRAEALNLQTWVSDTVIKNNKL